MPETLKPARSSKGKQVVEVVYSKSGYNIRKPGEGLAYRACGMDAELSALKAQHGTELYVKVVTWITAVCRTTKHGDLLVKCWLNTTTTPRLDVDALLRTNIRR